MQNFFTCKHCGKQKPINPKLKGNQHYCGDSACQKARKAAWQRQKMSTDPEYNASQNACLQKWRKSRPLDKYQNQYRLNHPEYVKKNRQAQKFRNRMRDLSGSANMIVKMDALKNIKTNTYIMTPLKSNSAGKIVKMDALIVELSFLQQVNAPNLPISNDCKNGPY